MKNFIFYSSLLICVSCTRGNELKNENVFKNYEIIKIDGCEYIQYGSSHGYLHVTHKGNCDNPIHKKDENHTD
jgi:hypothetical protein